MRYVDMSAQLIKVLKEWKLACPHSRHGLVFPNSKGEYTDANNMLKRRFKPALARAGINAIRFHDLRHTYASLLLAKNIHPTPTRPYNNQNHDGYLHTPITRS